MQNKLVSFFFLICSFLFSQLESNYSYQMKYGNGKQITLQASDNPDTTNYSYIEHLLDINTYIGNNIYTFIQIEYSNPPIFGNNRNSLDSLVSTFYIEYLKDDYSIKLGDIYELYGRGLSFYTFQDQNIDYNNSIKGLSMYYYIKENIKLSGIIGTDKFTFRSLPSNRVADFYFHTNIRFGSIDIESNSLGLIQAAYLSQDAFFPIENSNFINNQIELLCNGQNKIGQGLQEIATEKTQSKTCVELGQYPYTVNSDNFNVNWNYFLGPIEVYIDKAWIYYDRIHYGKVFGSRFYSSIYTEVFDIGITYDFKNYYTPYLIKSMANPPIVYRESNSILASRNSHSINFGDEIGHQLDINKSISNSIDLNMNISLSYRHKIGNMNSISLIDVITMNHNNKLYDYYPFRQLYFSLSGWTFKEKLYYKLGIDHFNESTLNSFGYSNKQISALTIPTQWVWKFNNNNSLTAYYEIQQKIESQLDSDANSLIDASYDNSYISLSFSYKGKLIISGFYDKEIKKYDQMFSNDKSNYWPGIDLSYKLNPETMVSIFYGSQKGGLVCANGICAEQPAFDNGFKITLRSIF